MADEYGCPLTFSGRDRDPAASPDGRQLAFLRGGDGPSQIWLLPVAGGEAEPITELPKGAGARAMAAGAAPLR